VSDPNEQPPADKKGQFKKRDAESQIVLGSFVTLISIPALIGTFWAETKHAMIVNVVAGLVLLGIGVTLALIGVKRRFS
jgi:hypothetical protein